MKKKNDAHIKHLIVTVLTVFPSQVLCTKWQQRLHDVSLFPLYAALHVIMLVCIADNAVVVLRCIKRS